MYSWEIKNLLELKKYLICANEYINICSTSPQITRVKYEASSNTFKIDTNDNYQFIFKVIPPNGNVK